jgi:GNAT superfamily N-acetyltransferase
VAPAECTLGRVAAGLTFQPLTAARWPDVVRLFGPRGACAGCWCMWWRRSRAEFVRGKGDGNQRAFHRVVEAGPPPGVLAYAGGEPVGWCAVAPRADYPRFAGSRVLAAVDDAPVWSVTCFFVARSWRGRGVSRALLDAATRFARRRGARIVEGYPIDAGKKQPDVFVYTGLAPAFAKAGFREVARRSPTRPIVRRRLN